MMPARSIVSTTPVDHLVDAGAAFGGRRGSSRHSRSATSASSTRHIRSREQDFGETDLRFAGAATSPDDRRTWSKCGNGSSRMTIGLIESSEISPCRHRARFAGRPCLGQHADIIFQIMPDLQHRIVGEQRVNATASAITSDGLSANMSVPPY